MSQKRRNRLALLSLFVWVMATPLSASRLADDVVASRQLATTRSMELASPVTLGSGTITPGQGATIRVLLTDGRPAAIALSGVMTFTYTVANRFSAPVAERNLAGAGIPFDEKDGKLVVSVPVQDAVIWDNRMAASLAPEDRTSESFQLPDAIGEIVSAPLFRRPEVDRVAIPVSDGPAPVNACLVGENGAFWVRLDNVVAQEETLYLLKPVPSRDPVDRGRWYRAELASQPVGRRWQDPVSLSATTIRTALDVTNDRDERLVVRAVQTIRSEINEMDRWVVPLRQRVFKGDDPREVRVRSVQVNGAAADYLLADNRLIVALPQPVSRGGMFSVTVETEGDIAIHPGGDNYWSLGTWAWYPQAPLGAEFSTFDITVRCPKDFTPFASGKVVSKGTENGLTVLKTRIDKPMQFPVVAAGHYHVYDGSHDGLSCTVTSYATGKEKHARRLQNNFFAAATYYASLFGMPYPFDHQDVIEVNSWGFGQAPPGVIFITQEAFSPLQDTLTRIFSGGVNERFVHEIAHAYWGHVIKMPNLEEQWLTESFAEYSAAMCIEAMNSNRKKGRKAFAKILNSWKGGVKTMGEGGSIFLANHFSGEQDTDAMDRIHLLYHKGPLVLHAIRLDLQKRFGKEKGDKAFIILLRAFLKNFPYQYGATHHLIGILNQLTKSDWQPWFDRYVFGTEVPPLG